PMMAADSNGTLSSILTTESLCTVMYGANVPSRFIGDTSLPAACTRLVPSAIALPPSNIAQRPEPFQARLTGSADGDEREDEVVTLLDSRHTLAARCDVPRLVMAAER